MRHAPAVSSLHRHRLADTIPLPGALFLRHRLAHASHAAKRPARTMTTVHSFFPVHLATRSRRQALYQ